MTTPPTSDEITEWRADAEEYATPGWSGSIHAERVLRLLDALEAAEKEVERLRQYVQDNLGVTW